MNTLIPVVKMKARLVASKFLRNEDGDVNIVSMVVLIGIAVLLAIVFKDQIGNLVKNLLNNITNSSTTTVTQNIQ